MIKIPMYDGPKGYQYYHGHLFDPEIVIDRLRVAHKPKKGKRLRSIRGVFFLAYRDYHGGMANKKCMRQRIRADARHHFSTGELPIYVMHMYWHSDASVRI